MEAWNESFYVYCVKKAWHDPPGHLDLFIQIVETYIHGVEALN